jgi:hypothetical protein
MGSGNRRRSRSLCRKLPHLCRLVSLKPMPFQRDHIRRFVHFDPALVRCPGQLQKVCLRLSNVSVAIPCAMKEKHRRRNIVGLIEGPANTPELPWRHSSLGWTYCGEYGPQSRLRLSLRPIARTIRRVRTRLASIPEHRRSSGL